VTESTVDTTASTTEAAGPTTGQQIDGLVADIRTHSAAVVRLEGELDSARLAVRNRAVDLVHLVGNRNAAAALLGITGRELASMLPRGTAR
jgi:hypothetical protein